MTPTRVLQSAREMRQMQNFLISTEMVAIVCYVYAIYNYSSSSKDPIIYYLLKGIIFNAIPWRINNEDRTNYFRYDIVSENGSGVASIKQELLLELFLCLKGKNRNSSNLVEYIVDWVDVRSMITYILR